MAESYKFFLLHSANFFLAESYCIRWDYICLLETIKMSPDSGHPVESIESFAQANRQIQSEAIGEITGQFARKFCFLLKNTSEDT